MSWQRYTGLFKYTGTYQTIDNAIDMARLFATYPIKLRSAGSIQYKRYYHFLRDLFYIEFLKINSFYQLIKFTHEPTPPNPACCCCSHLQ